MPVVLSMSLRCNAVPLSLAFGPETVTLIVLGTAVFLVLLTIIFLWNRTLRIRVVQRTAELEQKAAQIRELNEQLKISNEELQTSNEEYESANEELQLLNDDLNERNARLAEATEQMRALKDFNEKVIAAVPSVLIVVDASLRILSANDRYYSTFPGFLEKAEGALLSDALPRSLLSDHDIIRKTQEVARSSKSLRLPDVSFLDDQQVERFFDLSICPVPAEGSGDARDNNVLLVMNDITEMKRLQHEIASRECYFHDLVNNSIVAILATDGEGNLTLFNEGAQRLLNSPSEEMLGTPASRVFSREQDFHSILHLLKEQAKVEDYETEFVGPERETIEVSLFATSLRREDAGLIGHLIIGIDSRERKRAQRNLIRTNRELSTLYAVGQTLSSPDPIDQRLGQLVEQVTAAFNCQVCALAVCDPDDAPRVEQLFFTGTPHFPTEEIRRQTFEAMTRRVLDQGRAILGDSLLVDPDLSEALAESQEDGSFISVPLPTGTGLTGSFTVIKLNAPAFRSEDVELLSSIGHHIAVAIENEKLYAREKENVSRLRSLVNATRVIGSALDPDAVLDAIATEVVRIIPSGHAAVLSYNPDDRSLAIIAARSDPQHPLFKRGGSFAVRGDSLEEILNTSQPCFCPAGQRRECSIREAFSQGEMGSCVCMPMPSDGSPGLLTLGQLARRFLTDTEMHILSDFAAHASLSTKNARLYAQLQTAYADLKKAQDAMVKAEKYRAISELSAGVAHDFNNALSIILGRAQFLKTVTKDKAVLKGLASIENASRDAASTVKRMQQFSRSVSQRPFSRIDVNEMVRQVLETIEPRRKELAEVGGVLLDVTHKLQKVKPISGDVSELREALTNVVFNAIEAMPRGGKLTVRTGARGDRVFIEVQDTGVGMPQEVQKKALQPFFTTKATGMGLGLSLVYGTVKRHNGHIEISSQPQKGTTVTLLFPMDLSASEVHETPEPYLTQQGRILIVDDNPEVTQTLRQMLESASHKVVAVTEGQEGIRTYQESGFDIVIADIGMPGMSGFEVSKAIKAHDPDARIILITAWGVQLDEKQVEKSGASLVIQKPFEKARILSAIEELLSGGPFKGDRAFPGKA
jgi:PAS domain S-box-containing protein